MRKFGVIFCTALLGTGFAWDVALDIPKLPQPKPVICFYAKPAPCPPRGPR